MTGVRSAPDRAWQTAGLVCEVAGSDIGSRANRLDKAKRIFIVIGRWRGFASYAQRSPRIMRAP